MVNVSFTATYSVFEVPLRIPVLVRALVPLMAHSVFLDTVFVFCTTEVFAIVLSGLPSDD